MGHFNPLLTLICNHQPVITFQPAQIPWHHTPSVSPHIVGVFNGKSKSENESGLGPLWILQAN